MSLQEGDRHLIEVSQASIQLDLALVELFLAIKERNREEKKEEEVLDKALAAQKTYNGSI